MQDGSGTSIVEDASTSRPIATSSKTQQKRLARAERNAGLKEIRKVYEREKKKANRKKAKLAGEDVGKAKREAMQRPRVVINAKLIIDLSFDDLMTHREIISMVQQLSQSYSLNKMSSRPFESVVFTGPEGMSLLETSIGKRMESQMKGQWRSWKSVVIRENGGLLGLAERQDEAEGESQGIICEKDQLVYLTADSVNTIELIEEGKAYIIGGIVDRNRHKNLCASKAEKLGIQTARLPIDASRLNTSSVLTVNQVVDIMLTFNETQSWEETMDKCLPKRKLKEALKGTDEAAVAVAMNADNDDDDDSDALYNNSIAKT